MLSFKGFVRYCLSRATFLLKAVLALTASPVAAQGAPEDIVKALIAAEVAYDVDTAVAQFADDAVVRLGNGSVINTPAGIRAWQQELAAGHFHIEVVNIRVEGNTVSWTGTSSLDSFRRLGIAVMDSIWTLGIENGKIKTFDFSFTPEALIELQAGMTTAALIEAEVAHDVGKAVAQFADDAIVRHEGGNAYDTPESIRAWQQGLADGNFYLEPVGLAVEGNTVRWTGTVSLDSFRRLDIASLDGIWKLVIENGKIKTFDYSWTPQAAQTLKKAIEAHATPS